MFLRYVDRRAPKHEIQEALLGFAAENGAELSDARALNLADKFKRGKFDPDLAYILGYEDPTGEEASTRADREREGASDA